MRRLPASLMRLAVIAVLGASASGCMMGEEIQRGYVLDEAAVASLRPGTSAEQVLTSLGTPSTVSTVGNKSWYYISQRSRRRLQFMNETVVDQRVTAVYFNQALRVERVAVYGMQDGKIFDFISRTTPSGGSELSFIGQLFRGGTTFNPMI